MGKGKILVAMSGGVDSSVTAAICRQEGYEVIGVTMRLFDSKPKLPNGESEKEEDFADAKAVADKLGFPFSVLDLSQNFSKVVVNNFIAEYSSGRTPSPCIGCNNALKFGALAKKAKELGCVAMATGHYARIVPYQGRYALMTGLDKTRDQSYFLFTLTQEKMKFIRFPIGGLTKVKVREKAKKYGLKVAEKSESREICFVPDDDYVAYLEKHAPDLLHPGNIVNRADDILGNHRGIHRYTIGQRKGLGVAYKVPLYVLELRPKTNEVVVGVKEELGVKGLYGGRINWLDEEPLKPGTEVEVKIRYKQKGLLATCHPADDGGCEFHFKDLVDAVAPGQAVVAYIGDRVVCGGWIERALV